MTSIRSFFANLRYWFFAARIEREIYNRIAPHVLSEGDYGYPFDSREGLRTWCRNSGVDTHPRVLAIEPHIARMPKGHGEAFRYIFHRDLKARGPMPEKRLRMYMQLARESRQPETCDPRFIARRA